jgi:cellobiose-specific phosphotransferase system component IIB
MKRNTMMMLALAGMTTGLTAVNAEEAQAQSTAPAQKAQVVTTSAAQKTVEAVATKLSVDEQAFVAKLTDQNRKAFSDKFSAEQRKAVMIAVKNGASADEAVQRMVAAKDIKDSHAVANAEKATPAATK